VRHNVEVRQLGDVEVVWRAGTHVALPYLYRFTQFIVAALAAVSVTAFQSAMPRAVAVTTRSTSVLSAHHPNKKATKKHADRRPKKVTIIIGIFASWLLLAAGDASIKSCSFSRLG